ncbi:agmatine deiminase-like [Camellia sinensis]|uniref:agmatine deiminase-like n=1 Tax=Camellia sinensis TaxID=4442 RepID=UPI001035534C|nr:agmatine deiminase-like [Camellia sinensis]
MSSALIGRSWLRSRDFKNMSIFATIDKFVVRDIKSSLGNLERMLAGIDWNFNSYGGINEGCYKDWSLDIHAARKILGFLIYDS